MKVSLIDYMGSDLTVVNAARVSFNKESKRVKVAHYYDLSEKDQKLISYLAEHAHWSHSRIASYSFVLKHPYLWHDSL